MMISPGSLPIHGIFSPTNSSIPITMIKTPKRISIFPKAPISNSQISNVKVQMPNECQIENQCQMGKSQALDSLFDRRIEEKISVSSCASCHNLLHSIFLCGFAFVIILSQCFVSFDSFLQMPILC